jgi:DtxR family Mn-dependent transcriptional regulator
MRPAAVEQFLRTVSRIQQKSNASASIVQVAEAMRVPEQQLGEQIDTLVDRGFIEWETTDRIKLTPFGLRRLLTESIEDYLVTIYRLSRSQAEERVTTSAIAQALGVSAPSVTSMIQKKLTGFDLVDYERHRGVTLTPLGERIALQILRHHRIVELFLAETLGLPWDQIHDEANRLEHAMSPALIERIAALLGDPQVDPHGDPIPRKDGTVVRHGLEPLYNVPIGDRAQVSRVQDQSSDVLRYLSEIGLVPGTFVEIVERAPLNGPLTVRIDGKELALGRDLAQVVLVTPPQSD